MILQLLHLSVWLYDEVQDRHQHLDSVPQLWPFDPLLLNSHRKNEMAVLSYLKLVLKQ